jgi:hypothetical protein
LADNLKGTTMTHYHSYAPLGDLENPQDDLLLQSGLLNEVVGSWQFRIDKYALPLIVVSVTTGVVGIVSLSLAGADHVALVSWFLMTFSALPALGLFSILGRMRPASPGYILAALRRVPPSCRRDFLDQLNTVSLRGQRMPLSRDDVATTAKLVAHKAAPSKQRKDVRRRHTAQIQASLIDAFRHG